MKTTTIILFLIIGMLTSCKTVYVPVEKTTTIFEEIRDTVVKIDKDSAMITAILECDSLGNVMMKDYEAIQGKYNNLKFNLNNDVLKISSHLEMPDIKLEIKDRIINTSEVKYIEVEKKLKYWHQILMFLGLIFIGIILSKCLRFLKQVKKEIL